jgi:uncharacterized protein YndB with AHSA1/START domain
MTRSTEIRRHLDAAPAVVYRTLLDGSALPRWKVPDGMRCEVHEFEPREGGRLRVSLTYEEPGGAGKTTAHTDTYEGRFVRLAANEQVVEVDEFVTADPALRGEMTITITLTAVDDGTDLLAVHEGVPIGVSLADNATGWRMALDKLAALVTSQAGNGPRRSRESGS